MQILIYDGPKKLRVDEVPDLPLRDDELRINTLYSGISHGTEMNVYRGLAPFFRRQPDWSVRLFRPADETQTWHYPIRSCDEGVWYMGYANVGRVAETGKDVKYIKVGDIVYSSAPHQSQVIKKEADVIRLPENVKPEHAVFMTNLMTAFNGILDTRIKLGDITVISGLGVLGQLALQMARMNGALRVYGIDMFEKRRSVALANGADGVYDPSTCPDIAYEIRKLTGGKGADEVIEVSGNSRALNEAIRIAAPDTVVTVLSWYQGKCDSLDLSEEFHHNRIGIKQSQTGSVNTAISNLWNDARRTATCLELLGVLKLDNLISHEIPFRDAPRAYGIVDKTPAEAVQVVLTY